MTTNLLQEIVANKRAELREHGAVAGERSSAFGAVRNFEQALSNAGTRFIFECKRSSPSLGALRRGSIGGFVNDYNGIADAISVLTDQRYFSGELADLREARLHTDTPLLRKDFIVDPVQIAESYANGADAVLLMLSVLDDKAYDECARLASEYGLHVLTEVHTEEEMLRAQRLQARIIGINNRDLKTLAIDLETTRRLSTLHKQNGLLISESGIRHHKDICQLARYVDAFLVGSSLMQAPRLDLAARRLAFGDVKICGLTSVEAAQSAYNNGAVYGGLIFAPDSPRCVSLLQAEAIIASAPLHYVGVFTVQDVDEMVSIAHSLSLSAVQLHGDYSDDDVHELEQCLRKDVAIIRVVRVSHEMDHSVIQSRLQQTMATHFNERERFALLDTAGAKAGGNGQTFDWSLLSELSDKSRVFVAGGIRPDNVHILQAQGIDHMDVNSGVEDRVAHKSPELIGELFQQLRIGLSGVPV